MPANGRWDLIRRLKVKGLPRCLLPAGLQFYFIILGNKLQIILVTFCSTFLLYSCILSSFAFYSVAKDMLELYRSEHSI